MNKDVFTVLGEAIDDCRHNPLKLISAIDAAREAELITLEQHKTLWEFAHDRSRRETADICEGIARYPDSLINSVARWTGAKIYTENDVERMLRNQRARISMSASALARVNLRSVQYVAWSDVCKILNRES